MTVRDRDSTAQGRVPIDRLVAEPPRQGRPGLTPRAGRPRSAPAPSPFRPAGYGSIAPWHGGLGSRRSAGSAPRSSSSSLVAVAAVAVVTGEAAQAAAVRHVPGDLRGPPVPGLHRHHRQPGPQQHPGEPPGPRPRHRLPVGPAHLPVGRDAPPAELRAARRVAVHLRERHRRPDRATCPPCPAPGPRSPCSPRCPCSTRRGTPPASRMAAATTVTLTQAQVDPAMGHSLWVQGGTPTDPLVTTSFGNQVRLRRPPVRHRQPQR